jgi:hypothetical protein
MPSIDRKTPTNRLTRKNLRTKDQKTSGEHSKTRSTLAQLLPRSWSPEDLEKLRQAAWKNQGVAMLSLNDADGDLERQLLTNIANRRFGKRPGG